MFSGACNIFYNAVISLWREDPNVRMICLGTLIRKNVIFITNGCTDNLEPIHRTLLKTGTNVYDNTTSGYIIEKKTGEFLQIPNSLF